MCDFEIHEEVYSAFEGKVWRWRVGGWAGNGWIVVYHRSTRTAKRLPITSLFKAKVDAEAALVGK